jgi:hypothetical protein
MKRHEADDLQALKSFSAPARRRGDVTMVEAIATSVMTGQVEEADEFSKIPPFQA